MTGETILLVDSDKALLKKLKHALTAVDYEIETATSAEAGFTRVIENPTAIAIIGAGKDPADSLELVRKLSSESPQTQCILLCEDRSTVDSPTLYDYGNVFSIHSKPITQLADLGRDIGRAMEVYYLRRQNARLLIELRDARDDLRSQFEFLAQCEKLAALGQMTWDLTDDLRSTLYEISRYADALRRSLRECPIQSWAESHRAQMGVFVDGVEQVAEAGGKLVHGVSSFVKGESPSEELVDLHDVIQSAFGLLGHSFSARGIRIKSEYGKALPPIIADAGRLRQAIAHIASNAISAMATGGTITVVTKLADRETGGITLAIRDTGDGIEPDVLPHVFDPFYTTRPFGQGTGLGLYVAREIVREHGGEIDVESTVGRGSAFTIKLPVAAQAVADEDGTLALAA